MRDRFGIVPEHIRANYERDEIVDRSKKAAVGLDHALKQFDERLSCVYVREDVDPNMQYYGCKPGRFHVRRRNDPPAADTYMPIETPEGGFREPDSGVLEELRRRDSWSRDDLFPKIVVKQRNGFDYHDVDDGGKAARDEARADEQRRDEIKADVRAGSRVAGDGGLTARKWGKK